MITALGNEDPRFYQLLGPYLSKRKVVEFVGGPIWDDDGKVWFLAYTDTRVHGFCGVSRHSRPSSLFVESLYLSDPDDRDTAIRLVAAAVQRFGLDESLIATVRHRHAYAYEAAGFVRHSRSTRFTNLSRPEGR